MLGREGAAAKVTRAHEEESGRDEDTLRRL